MKRDKNSNIVRAAFSELESAGYKQSIPTYSKLKNSDIMQANPPAPGSLLCLVNKEMNLWAELSSADILKSKVNSEKFLIMEKVK